MKLCRGFKRSIAWLLAFAVAAGLMCVPVRVSAASAVYTITYHLDGGTNALKNPDVYTQEDTITLMDATKDGYDFAGWFLDAEKTEQIREISNMTGDLALYAKFTPKTYVATFADNGATQSSPLTLELQSFSTFSVNNGDVKDPYAISIPSFSSSVFLGWYNGGTRLTGPMEMDSDLKLNYLTNYCSQGNENGSVLVLGGNAKKVYCSGSGTTSVTNFSNTNTSFRSEEYGYYNAYDNGTAYYNLTYSTYVYISGGYKTITYQGQSNDRTWGSSSYYSSGSTSGGFYIEDMTHGKMLVSIDPGYNQSIDKSGTLTVAPGTLLHIFVTTKGSGSDRFSCSGTGSVSVGEKQSAEITVVNRRTASVEFDSPIQPPSVSKTGYTLLGWYDAQGNEITDTWQYTENQTFTAKWQPTKYKITYQLDGGTNSLSNPSSYTIEDTVTLKDPSKPGYTFQGWYSDAAFQTQVTQITQKTGNITLYAKFQVNRYNLTLDGNEGAFAPEVTFISDGTVIKRTCLFEEDSLTAYRPEGKEGYLFAGWYTDAACTNLFAFNKTVSDDTTLYAKWVACDSTVLHPEATESFDVTVNGKTEQLYAFSPLADGKITVTSESHNLDLYGILYDGEKNVLISADDISNSDLDFSYTYAVQAGQVYYIAVKGNTVSTSGVATITIGWTGSCTVTGTTYPIRQISLAYDTNYHLPTKPIREGYAFLGWFDETDTQVTDGTWKYVTDKTLTAKWEAATYHSVIFKDHTGEILSSGTYYLTEDIIPPELPTKAPDETYTYHPRWDDSFTGVCTGDAVYWVVFDKEYIDYTVIFLAEDGTELSRNTYHWGDPVTAPEAPAKAADNTYTYTFAGWGTEVVSCAGDATYTATYTPVYIDYTVAFLDWNGAVLSSQTYHYGDPVTAPADPTRDEDALHTYTFAGWNAEVVNCAGDATYTATYTKLRKDGLRYTIQGGKVTITDYVGSGGTVIIPDSMEGLQVTAIGANAFHSCTGIRSIVIPRSVTDIGDNAFLGCAEIDTVFFRGTEGERANIRMGVSNEHLTHGATWHYEVSDQALGEQSVYRCGKCGLLYNGDGTCVPLVQLQVISQPDKVRYITGETVDLTGLSLQGVYAEGVTVSLDAAAVQSVVADLSAPGKKTVSLTVAGCSADFEIYVHDGKDIILDAPVSLYPESAHNYANNLNQTKTYTYPGAQSLILTFNRYTKVESNYDFIYIYDGQDNLIGTYTGVQLAQKTLTVPGNKFKITLTSDSSTTYYGYGFELIQAYMGSEAIHVPVTDPATVTCTQAGLTEGSHCEICGDILVEQEEVAAFGHDYLTNFQWSEDHTACTATLTCARNCGDQQTVACTVTVSEPDPAQIVHTAAANYAGMEFTDVLTCSKSLIVFVDWDGTQISSTYYHAGAAVTAPADPERAADNTYTYTFAGWDREVVACAGDATYTATYTPTYINYTVTFVSEDGTVLSQGTYHWGDPLTVPDAPEKAADNTYTYTFAGWGAEVVSCTGNATYTATYTATYINYTVTFVNEDGTILSQRTYHWGDRVYAPANPKKPEDEIYTYTFAGWDKEIVNCCGDATYTATYTATEKPVVYLYTNGQITYYTTLAQALENASADQYNAWTLLRDVQEDIVISKSIYMDLNGFDLVGNVTVVSGVDFYVKDYKTEDFTVEDGEGYGKIIGTVEGVKASWNYMMITEEDGVSFHYIELDIHTMTLRPSEVGVYYQSNFSGDEMVARNVARYGIALSVSWIPTEEHPGICSWYEDFQPGDGVNAASGTLLHGIMKTKNTDAVNAENAQRYVYGRTYILTKDGQYIFGDWVCRNFRQQVEDVDLLWQELNAEQRTAILAMYETYKEIMKDWNIPNIRSAAQ